MKAIKWFIKSNHFWMWIVFVIGIIGYLYSIETIIEDNDLLRLLEKGKLYFLFLAGSGVWMFIYTMVIFGSDIDDI